MPVKDKLLEAKVKIKEAAKDAYYSTKNGAKSIATLSLRGKEDPNSKEAIAIANKKLDKKIDPDQIILDILSKINEESAKGRYRVIYPLAPKVKDMIITNYFKKKNYLCLIATTKTDGKVIVVGWMGGQKWMTANAGGNNGGGPMLVRTKLTEGLLNVSKWINPANNKLESIKKVIDKYK